eukprot:1567149-Rhodomonas_salina.1
MTWTDVVSIDDTRDPVEYTITVAGRTRVTTRDKLFVPKDDRFEPDEPAVDPDVEMEDDAPPDVNGKRKRKSTPRKPGSKGPKKGPAFVAVDDPEYFDHDEVPKDIDVEEFSATVSRLKGDLDIPFYAPRVDMFIQTCTEAGAAAVERGEREGYLHFQIAMKMRVESAITARNILLRALGWSRRESKPPKTQVEVKTLTGQNLHTWFGIVGYVQKDRDQPHFEISLKNLSEEDLKNGREEFALWGKIAKSKVVLTPKNIYDKARLFLGYRCEDPTQSIEDFPHVISQMVQSGAYDISSGFVFRNQQFVPRVETANALWKALRAPMDITKTDILWI